MVRLDYGRRDNTRFTAEQVEGGLRLAWTMPIWSVPVEDGPLRLYRSTEAGTRGVLVRENPFNRGWQWIPGQDFDYAVNLWSQHPWIYEFIDTDVLPGGVYYYSLWRGTWRDYGQNIYIGGQWQMRVVND
jgi:hypothetical protein